MNTLWQMGSNFLHHFVRVDLSIGSAAYLMIPIGALIAFKQQQARQDIGRGMKAFMRFCIPTTCGTTPKSIFKHSSPRLDIGFVIVKRFVNDWLLAPTILISPLVAHMVYALMTAQMGSRQQHVASYLLIAAMIAFCVVAQDFVQFFIHYLHHKMKLLWDVHKVHHSAEFLLIGFSVKRTHLIEEAINESITALILGISIGVMSYSFSLSIWLSEFFGIDAWFFVQLFSFWHLRHSHISLSYGWLEYIFQSPAQHQLHHSFKTEHWDKNFGLIFSCWDMMFSCFVRSGDPREIALGLPPADRRDYDNVLKLYVTPFRKIFQATSKRVASAWSHANVVPDQERMPQGFASVERPPVVVRSVAQFSPSTVD